MTRSLPFIVFLLCIMAVISQVSLHAQEVEGPVEGTSLKLSIPGDCSGKISPEKHVWGEFTVPTEGLESFYAVFRIDGAGDPAMVLYDESFSEITSADAFGPSDRTEYLASLFLKPGKYYLLLRSRSDENPLEPWTLKISSLPPVTDDEIGRALNKALDYLIVCQKENGDFGDGYWSAGINGLVLQALMGTEDGKRNDWKAIFKGIDFIKNYYHDPASIKDPCDKLLYGGGIFQEADKGMYEHGIALTALIEAYALGVKSDLEPIIRNALDYLLKAQLTEDRPADLNGPVTPENRHYGGWRYYVNDLEADISVTGWQIIALVSAQKVGFPIPSGRLDKIVSFAKKCFCPELQSFEYMIGGRDTAIGRCAMGALCMHLGGTTTGVEYETAVREILKKAPSWEEEPRGYYPFYYWYYGTRLAYLIGGDIWQVWRRNVCGILVRHQEADGSWRLNHSEERSGKAYITALGAMMLEIGAGYPPFYLRSDRAPRRAPARSEGEITVSITSPANGTTVKDIVVITAKPVISENGKIKRVSFYLDDKKIGELNEGPWEIEHDFGSEARVHKIRVEVESEDGNKAEATVTTKEPVNLVQVKIHRPPATRIVYGSDKIVVDASAHPESPIEEIIVTVNDEEIFRGSSVPGDISYEFEKGRSHKITAIAVNSLGKQASDTVVTLEPLNDISVSLLEPNADSLMKGECRIKADVRVPDGNVVKQVIFFVDDEEVAAREEEPWETDFHFGETPKSRLIKVVAENAQGKRTEASVKTREPQSTLEISIKSPKNEIVTGEREISVLAFSNPESPLKEVRIFVDETEIYSGSDAEISIPFDFGPNPCVHQIFARAENESGKTAEDRIETAAPPPLEVNLTAIVTDEHNNHVLDCIKENFHILENGVEQTVTTFTREVVPVNVALILDTSGSMKKSIADTQKAAQQFISKLQPRDQMILMEFSDDVNILRDFTSDISALSDAVKQIKATRGTALYDAVIAGCKKLKEREGKTVIVLLSDGKDEDNAGTKPGSKHTMEEALQFAKESEAIIYPLGLGKKISKDFLDTLARETGGRAYYPPTAKDLAEVYGRIAAEFRSQYSIGYSSTNRTRDGAWRTIEISIPGTGHMVRTRKGFFAR